MEEDQGRLELGERQLTQCKERGRLHEVRRRKEEYAGADIHVAINVLWHQIELDGGAPACAIMLAKPEPSPLRAPSRRTYGCAGGRGDQFPNWPLICCSEKTSETAPKAISTVHPGTAEPNR